jgi:hypothetical protein
LKREIKNDDDKSPTVKFDSNCYVITTWYLPELTYNVLGCWKITDNIRIEFRVWDQE